MGKRTLVHITKNSNGRYGWTGKNSECCIMAVHTNSWISDIDLDEFVRNKEITSDDYEAIIRIDEKKANEYQFNLIKQLAEKLQLKIVIHKQPTIEVVQ